MKAKHQGLWGKFFLTEMCLILKLTKTRTAADRTPGQCGNVGLVRTIATGSTVPLDSQDKLFKSCPDGMASPPPALDIHQFLRV